MLMHPLLGWCKYVADQSSAMTEREKMLAGELYDPLDNELFGWGGETVWMQPPFFCDYGTNIELGERVFFNFNCIVLDVCRVRIGDCTLIGPAVQIYTAMHPMDAAQRRVAEFGKPVDVGSDVWIGGGAIILPGVRIGSRAVIGAGSVVTRDVPEQVFAAGNPCRVIRPA
jgi:maltose O-acetyltransferase